MRKTPANLPVVYQADAPSSSFMILLLSGFAICTLNLAITLFVLDHYDLLGGREIVSVNAADTLMAFVASQDPTISSEELERRVKALNVNIDAEIDHFANQRGVIVVNSAAILAGARDATGELLGHLEISK